MGCLNATNSHDEINLNNLDGGNAPNTLFDSDPEDNQREEIIGHKSGYYSNSNNNSHDDLKIESNPGIENKINVLRKEANEFGEKMSINFEKSQEEFKKGGNDNKEMAKKLSDEGKKCKDKMIEKNIEAKAIAFDYKNKGRGIDEIDLHLLLVDEALFYIQERIQKAKESKLKQLVIIHGQGQHSDKNGPKIKPACYKYLDSIGINYTKDVPNPGCLTIKF